MSGGLFPVSARERKATVARPLCSPSSGDLDADQIEKWCANVEEARSGDPDLSDETHLYNLGLDPRSHCARQVLAALRNR